MRAVNVFTSLYVLGRLEILGKVYTTCETCSDIPSSSCSLIYLYI